MKLKNFLAMMAIALCAVACSDNDDKKEDTVIPAQEVAGIYNGTLSLSVSGNDQGTSDSQVKNYCGRRGNCSSSSSWRCW